ncbi:hypothetical protein ACA910_005502 [Epithemia clementina (nom. ined.)]
MFLAFHVFGNVTEPPPPPGSCAQHDLVEWVSFWCYSSLTLATGNKDMVKFRSSSIPHYPSAGAVVQEQRHYAFVGLPAAARQYLQLI